MAETKMCPYCGGEAVIRHLYRLHPDLSVSRSVNRKGAKLSLCDDCARFEWL